MMAVARRIESQQLLQQPVDRCRCEEVAPTYDVGDALQRVVYDHRQMVGRRPVLAAQDDIPPGLRRRVELQLGVAFAEFAPEEPLRSERPRASHVEPAGRPARPRPGVPRFHSRRRRYSRRDATARRRDRARRRCGESRRACRSRDRPARAAATATAPPRSPRDARSAGAARPRRPLRATPCLPGSRLRIRACSASDRHLRSEAAARRRCRAQIARCGARNRRARDAADRWASARSGISLRRAIAT